MPSQHVMLNGSFAASVINFRGPFISAMIEAGHKVTVTVPDLPRSIRAQVEALGARIHQVPLQRTGTNIAADLRYRQSLKQIMQETRPDLTIGYTIKPNIWGSLAARSEKIRSASMVTGLGYTFIQRSTLPQKTIGAISAALYRRATAANDVVIFQNRDDRDDFISAGCLQHPAKARLVNGSGVDVEAFQPAPLPPTPVFLMAARLLVSKGVREYAQAAISLKKENPEYRFLLAGDRDESPDSITPDELSHWIDAGIEHLGWVNNIAEIMAQASIYVLPSYREGTPRTVLEASAMGRPTITTDAPGCRETVEHGKTGLIVPVQDVSALTQAMREMAMLCAEERQTIGEVARARCVAKYSVTTVNRALMDHLGL